MTSAHEQIRLDERRHGIVLAGAFLKAAALAAVGGLLVAYGWPAMAFGVAMLGIGALFALRAAWQWERTRIVLTTEKLFVVHGTVRRRAAGVRLSRLGAVEVEQSILGQLLGYGTIVAGDLEITHVPHPRQLAERLG